MKTIKGRYNEAKIFATTIEESCEQQVLQLMNESWMAGSKVRIMADCHSGKGCVIGTTMTITDKVVPNLVGVDIGCGMLTLNLGKVYPALDMAQVDRVIKNNIPMGKNIRTVSGVQCDFEPHWNDLYFCKNFIDHKQVSRSIGTLGGGNHFIEIDKDDEDNLYLVVHTGSRNFGKRVADYYQEKAKEYHKKNAVESSRSIVERLKEIGEHHRINEELAKAKSTVNEDLAYLEGSLFDAYINDMKIAQSMASMNRKTIANIILRCLHLRVVDQFETVHNYIDIDNMILRKGAISARAGERCLIPINMRDGALICVGKGNADYNYSAPHGAGRLMSRNEAKKTLTMESFKDSMSHVYSSTVNESTLDEAPMAYKPMEEILENIKDTVEVVKQIKPIYNVKAEE